MVNLIAAIEGDQPGIILFGSHYDTRHLPEIEFLGANSGGSTTAWLLEQARALGPRREGRTLWLAWFDGKEVPGEAGEPAGLHGSRAFVRHLEQEGTLENIALALHVEMIGDCYLRVSRDEGAPPWLETLVWDTAQRLGYGNHFSTVARNLQADHVPLRRAGIPALLLMDFVYGGSILEHEKNLYTAEDTLEKVCPESLQAIADVLYHALPAIEAQLDTAGTPLP